ncbi:short-chain collagen C4-like isoform X2 [Mytilus californianus]|uniref:short-chain collagen C4-like isoform X2 n=1 Tax=Mytilus californianus TaxID=6549 RepID=UPI0022460611|nr:short-chain collagen C4-like isoform X2 [Mytilus californianus]XP_052084782.1 short-chain collagen C4-like isoform X2 [Mytilus californianus]
MGLFVYIFCIMVAFMFSERPALQTEKSVLELFPEFVSLKQDNQNIKAELAALKSKQSEIGTTYIRWSRKQCPNNGYTELVYSGYAGGGIWSEAGSAAEPVCLPSDPDFVKTSGTGYGRIYGAEFESEMFASNSLYQDIPCAVCRVKQVSSVIMIPGKNRCYTGWKIEYHGYLAASCRYSQPAAGSYVCIDIHPEYVSSGSSFDSQSQLFYDVAAKCGSLRCPPYKQDYPLTCVVCSK